MPCSDSERNKCLFITQLLTVTGHGADRAERFGAALAHGGENLPEVIGHLLQLEEQDKELVRLRIREMPDDEALFLDAFRAVANDAAHPVLVVTLSLEAPSSLVTRPLGEPGDVYVWLSLE